MLPEIMNESSRRSHVIPPGYPILPVYLAQNDEQRIHWLAVMRMHIIEGLLEDGFHMQLDNPMSVFQYIASIPILESPVPEQREKFLKPVLVDPRISVQYQLQQMRIRDSLSSDEIFIFPDQTQGAPYWIWVKTDFIKDNSLKVKTVRGELGLTLHEGLAFLRQRKERFIHARAFVFTGSPFVNAESGEDDAPCVEVQRDSVPKLRPAHGVQAPHGMFSVPTCVLPAAA